MGALAFTFLFLPQFLLTIFCTLNLRSKNSLKIITRHPSLILLPIFTFFTFAKVKVGCSADESRVRFSKRFSWSNIGVSLVGYVTWAVWFYYRFDFGRYAWSRHDFYALHLSSTIPPLVLSAILTALFLHLDRVCCSECARVPGEQISVYDPVTDKRYIMDQDTGEIIPVPEEDEETGNNPSHYQAEVQETDTDTTSETAKVETHQEDDEDTEMNVLISTQDEM